MSATETILNEIKVTRLTQPAIAEICAMAMMRDGVASLDWKAINAAIVERWSKSARERVLNMAWRIIEKARENR